MNELSSSESPESTLRKFAQCMHDRDLDGLVALYEPEAIFAAEPGRTVKGHDGLRVMFQELFGIKPAIQLVTTQVHECGDLALVNNDWTLSGTAPDDTPVIKSGCSTVVLRRSSEATWLIAIDRP